MINLGNLQGVNFESSNYKYFGNFEGINFESSNYKYFGNFEGINFSSAENLKVEIRKQSDNSLISAFISIENTTTPTDQFTNGLTNFSANTHSLYVQGPSNLSFLVNLTGYETSTTTFSLTDVNAENLHVIYITEIVSSPIICTTKSYNSIGTEVQVILDNGYIETEFTGLKDGFSYNVYIEAYQKGGQKTAVQLLDYSVINQTNTSVLVRYKPLPGQFAYIPNITLND
jgi:hypothetical protein